MRTVLQTGVSRIRVARFLFSTLLIWCRVPASSQTKPLTLEESVALAQKQSPVARSARYAWEMAGIQAEREKPVASPTLNATFAGTAQTPRRTLPLPDGTAGVVLPEAFGQASLVLEQPLYRAGLGAAQQRYGALTEIASLDYRKTLAEIALSARKACLDVLRAESGVHMAEDGLESARKYQIFVKQQIAAGLAKPVDADTATAQVAEAKEGLLKAEGGLALARLNFNRTLGRPLETLVDLAPLLDMPTIPDRPDTALQNARTHRPELLSLAENRRQAAAGVALARTQNQPSLYLRGQLTEQTRTLLLPQNFAAVTLEVRWPLLDAGKTRLDTREAQAGAKRLEALAEEAEQGILVDVLAAWQKLKEARERVNLTQVQRQGAEAAATVARKAYEVGRGTAIEVQVAEREVRSARERENQALYDLHTSAAEFNHAQGLDLPEAGSLSSFTSSAKGKKRP